MTAPVILGPGFHADGVPMVFSEPTDRFCVAEVHEGAWGALAEFCEAVPPRGAIVGMLAYEAAQALEPTLSMPKGPAGWPVLWAGKFDAYRPVEEGDLPPLPQVDWFGSSRTSQAYQGDVQAIVAAIADGDLFQANISRELSAPIVGDGSARFDPQTARYSAWLPQPRGAILSLSPELFFEMDKGSVVAEPVKGTRPRGQSIAEDRAAVASLETDEKDRAENIMIADLLRNDLSKVCEDHSIVEDAICAVRTLPYVHHLYSRISGRVRNGVGPIDVAQALFPCGSITGAPKHRAMQRIGELEQEGRGPYCGSVFALYPDGHSVFSVAIRTAIIDTGANQVSFRSGGGVTILSDPAAEYQETEVKAQILKDAFG